MAYSSSAHSAVHLLLLLLHHLLPFYARQRGDTDRVANVVDAESVLLE